MLKIGDFVKVRVNYPRQPRLNGEYAGRVVKVGRFRSGYCFFELDRYPGRYLPNSGKYVRVLEKKGG